MPADSIVIAGSLAQKAHQGGHTWQFLQYILGFKRIGWDVLFVDCLEPEMCFDAAGRPCPVERSVNLRYLVDVMRGFGLEDNYAVICEGGTRYIGQSKAQVLERTRRAELLLNVMGFLRDEDVLGRARLRVFLDTDPGYGQMWHDLGLASVFKGHDRYVTIAENIGEPGCTIPTCGIDWVKWRQPVVLDQWPAAPPNPSGAFISIGAWRGPYGPLEYRGETYGLRAHEFRRFAELPRLSPQRFEAALDIHPADAKDIELLQTNGWRRADAAKLTRDPWAYRDYVGSSKAEFMVARNMYVRSNCGWFSERSICFLAAGRPVLAQDTGIGGMYPSGQGLVLFSRLEEALAGVESISADYDAHARVAREIAEACFDSDRVIGELVAKLSSPAPAGGVAR